MKIRDIRRSVQDLLPFQTAIGTPRIGEGTRFSTVEESGGRCKVAAGSVIGLNGR